MVINEMSYCYTLGKNSTYIHTKQATEKAIFENHHNSNPIIALQTDTTPQISP